MSRKPLGNAIPIAINKYINTAYDTILLVAQNLDTIKAVADQVTYLNTYLGESDTPPTKRPNGDPLESGDFYYDNKAVYYYEASDQSWTKVDPEELKAAAQTALDSANTAVQAKDEAVEAADKAKSYTSGTDIGDYADDPTFNVITDYVVYGRGTAGITLWKVEENVTLPYDVNSTTYPHPSDDPNLRAYTATAQLYTYEETTYLTDGQVIVDAQSELTNFVVYLWDAASGERHKLDVVYDYTTNASNQIVLLDTYPVGSKLTIVFEDIGQNSDTYIKKQEAEQLYGDHTKQANRGSANAHPASSISTTSGDTVEQALGKKATKEELSESIAESQNDIVGGSIFKGSNGETIQNGDVVPAGTTHLRVLVGGESAIVAMSPVASGVISNLTESSAKVGGADVIFYNWLLDSMENSPLKVRVDQNEQDTFRNLDECKKMLSRIHLGRGGNIWNFGRIVNILGDSISHGAYAGELYFNGWTQILRRMANIEFGGASWGFVSIKDSETSGSDFFQEVHNVVRNGSWTEKFRTAASYIVNGFGLRSATGSDNLQIKVPTFTDKFVVWWSKLPSGGNFEVYVNGVLKATQPTFGSAEEGWFLSTSIDMQDNGKGSCDIEIRVVGDGDVEILGMSYFNSTSDLMINNFSQFGRRLSEVDEQVIIKSIQGATDFVLALGYNDAGPANSDPQVAAAFTQRIDWIIQYCNQYNVNAVILDFNWARPESWHVRKELERCAKSINSAKFVPFPRYLSIDNQPQSPAGYLQPIGFLVDDAHPTVLGHGMIAETVSSALGFSVTSKEHANRNDPMWIPFQISNVNDLENRYPSQPKAISAWRFNGGSVEMKWHVQRAATAPFVAGSYRLVDSTDFNIAQGQFVETKFQAVSTSSDGNLVVSTQRMDARQFGGEINIVIDPKNTSLYSEWFGVLPLTPYR